MPRAPDPRRRTRRRPARVWPAALRAVVPAAYGAALLSRLYAPDGARHPAVLVLLAAFIGYFGWRIHALVARSEASDLERVEVGLLAVLGLATGVQYLGVPGTWAVSLYGLLLVVLSAGVTLPGILALPLGAVTLWETPETWLTGLAHLELLALASGVIASAGRRKRARLQATVEKYRLDTGHLRERADAAEGPAVGDLAHLDEVLYSYLDEVKRNANAHSAVLAVLSQAGRLYVREIVSDSHSLHEPAAMRLEETAFAWILKNQKPLTVARLRDPAGRLGYYRGRGEARSFVGVPLSRGGRVEGVLGLDSLAEGAFQDADLSMLKVASHQILTILDQIQTLEQARRTNKDLRILNDFSKSAARCGEGSELVELLLASLRERFHPDFSAVVLADPEGTLQFSRVGEQAWKDLEGQQFSEDDGLAGWVLHGGQYLHYDEGRSKVRRPLFAAAVEHPELQSIMLHPLVSHDHKLGVLCVGSREPHHFEPAGVVFCEMLAQVASQGLLQIRNLRELRALATSDALTGLANRRVLFERLASEVARSHRYEHGLALIVLDVDHFKQVNDRHGHPAGDEVLRCVARSLAGLARETDLVARHGGEEFAVVLPNTAEEGARALAERARSGLEALEVRWEKKLLPVRASFGVAALEAEGAGVDNLVSRADQALYAAKETGRNRVVAYSEIREYVSWK